jgi:hypothetical protein
MVGGGILAGQSPYITKKKELLKVTLNSELLKPRCAENWYIYNRVRPGNLLFRMRPIRLKV